MSEDIDETSKQWVKVPVEALSDDALMGLIEEFSSRDGTDYGAVEVDLEQKVKQVKLALASGECGIVFDQHSESCQIVDKELLQRLASGEGGSIG